MSGLTEKQRKIIEEARARKESKTPKEKPASDDDSFLSEMLTRITSASKGLANPMGLTTPFMPPDVRTGEYSPESEALYYQSANAAFMGIPVAASSLLGFEGPAKRLKESRELTGGYGAAAEGLALLPSSLLFTGGSGLGKQIATGLGYGGFTGATLAEEGQGLSGAGIGAGIGAGVPLALKGIGAGLNLGAQATGNLYRRLSASPQERAVSRVRGALQDIGKSPQDLRAGIDDPSPITLAEQTAGQYGEGVMPVVRQATAKMGKAREDVLEQLGERTAGAAERVSEVAEKALPKGNARQVAAQIKQRRSENADEMYGQAFDEFVPDEDVVSSVAKLFHGKTSLPKLNSILPKAMNTVRNDVKLRERGITIPLSKTVEVAGKQVSKPLEITDLSPQTFTRVLNNVKTSLDDEISSSMKKGKWGKVRELTNLKDSFIEIIDDANPLYATARANFAGETALKNALEMGETLYNKKISNETVRSFLKNATESEKEHFRLGISKFVQDQLESGTVNNIKVLFNKDFKQKLKSAWPDEESFNAFENTVRNEIKMSQNVSKLKTGAGTVPGEEETILGTISDAVGSTPVVSRAAGGSKLSAAAVALAKGVQNVFGRFGTMSADEAEEVTRIMLAATPAERKAAINLLVEKGKINQAGGEDLVNIIGGFIAGPKLVTPAAVGYEVR